MGFKYAEALARRHEVVVLSSPPSQTPTGATLLPCNAGPCSFNEVGAMPLLRFELRQLSLARRLRRRFQYDFVHRVTPSAIQLPTWAARLGRPFVIGPLIAAERPPAVFAPLLARPVSAPSQARWHPARAVGRLCRMAVQRAGENQAHLREAKRLLVGTRTALRHVPEGLREKCRLVTYSGVEHEVFKPESGEGRKENGGGGAGTTGLRDYGTTDRSLRLLFVGRLVPYKGVELLLRAVAVASKKCALSLDIVGGGDPVYKDYLVRLCGELGLAVTDHGTTGLPDYETTRRRDDGLRSSVRFWAPVAREELPALYQQADVFCFPTLCDTYGIALLEAMSCGCAVLVSDVAGAGEIVNSENGIKVPLRNPDQYIQASADAIVALAMNTELRARLGSNARQFIVAEHDWDRIGEQILSIYSELEHDFLRLSGSPVVPFSNRPVVP